ncbi:MAG: hypothetical protein TREMPRED_002739 [Tremellales sp. Tagirdzhanova-0007]|nr:MAG: hypothetical protein TREMPRED_002739 [Tremellales sp. Tagirdzhanova-0007]
MRISVASSSHLAFSPLRCIKQKQKLDCFPLPRRFASTASANTDWVSWLRKASALNAGNGSSGAHGRALLFAGLGSYPHTPHAPTPSSILVWEQASEALLTPDETIVYQPKEMEEFAGGLGGSRGDELMTRADVTSAFILTSSLAVLASAQEASGSPTLLPPGTSHLAGHGFIGTLTALVVARRLDLQTGVRLASIYASLPSTPAHASPSKHYTTVLSARLFHSLSSPPWDVLPRDSEASRRRAMQLILDEVHRLQKEWQAEGVNEWVGAGIINSSKVLVVTGTQHAVLQAIERLQQLNLANPVMDVRMPSTPENPAANAPLTPEQLEAANQVAIFNGQGGQTTFGEVIRGKRTLVVFIRHFWCVNCQAYTAQLGTSIPPHNLPTGTGVIIVGCGSYQPIEWYAGHTHSPYPVYACPSLELHKIFGFTTKLGASKKGEEKEYERDLGGMMSRVWMGLVVGPMQHIEHMSSVGPKGQNGGEMVFEADGQCSFIHRMQHSADHTELEELADVVGAQYVPSRRGSEVKEGRNSMSRVERPDVGQTHVVA